MPKKNKPRHWREQDSQAYLCATTLQRERELAEFVLRQQKLARALRLLYKLYPAIPLDQILPLVQSVYAPLPPPAWLRELLEGRGPRDNIPDGVAPSRVDDKLEAFLKTYQDLRDDLGRVPEAKELAAAAHCSASTVKRRLRELRRARRI